MILEPVVGDAEPTFVFLSFASVSSLVVVNSQMPLEIMELTLEALSSLAKLVAEQISFAICLEFSTMEQRAEDFDAFSYGLYAVTAVEIPRALPFQKST